MSEIQGYIEFLDEKTTTYGTMYDIKVNGTKYGVGKYKPKGIDKGDYVKFDAEQKGKYWNVKAGSLQKLDKPAGAPAPARSNSGGGGGNFDDRQVIISKQAALNTSLSFVEVLAAAGALPMPAKVAQDKKADLMERIVFDYAAKFYNFSTGSTLELPAAHDAADLALVEEAGNWSE
jgi:hypothetical protein